MSTTKIRVLIVEDDTTLGQGLERALKKQGYDAKWVPRPDEGLKLAETAPPYQALIVDCMLPKMNGVDFSIKALQRMPNSPLLILMSGIFREKSFITEAMAKSGAAEFLVKPFEIEDVILLLDNHFASEDLGDSRSPVSRLLMLKTNDAHQQIEAIRDLDSVHSFELPAIYSLLMDSGVTGHLNIIDADGHVAGVGFSNGSICQVDVKKSTSFFVSLLIEKGFVFPNDIEQALTIPSRKRVGERLIDANVLSPHAIDVVLREQMAILLSKTVKDSSAKITLLLADTVQGDSMLSKETLLKYFHDWTTSKYTLNWLRSTYLQWLDNPICPGANFDDWAKISEMPQFSNMPDLFKKIEKGTTLSRILEAQECNEIDIYRAIHLLTICRIITFDSVIQDIDLDQRQERLEKLQSSLQDQTYYEILGVGSKAGPPEIERAYRELHKLAAPEVLPVGSPETLLTIAAQVFEQVQSAYQCLMDPTKRQEYNQQLEIGKAEILLQAEALFSEGKAYLKKNMISKAVEAFEESAKLNAASAELNLHLLWTKIKTLEAENKLTPENLARIDGELNRIPPEERHNSTYYYVRGLHQMASGDIDGAKKHFEHILSRDKNFIEAKRELNRIKLEADKKPKDLLSTDVRDVFGMIFKKKKTG